MAMASTIGLMVRFTKASGRRTKCTDAGSYNGKMASDMKAIFKMISVKVRAHFNGLTVANTSENGRAASNTVSEGIATKLVSNAKANGRTDIKSDGLTLEECIIVIKYILNMSDKSVFK